MIFVRNDLMTYLKSESTDLTNTQIVSVECYRIHIRSVCKVPSLYTNVSHEFTDDRMRVLEKKALLMLDEILIWSNNFFFKEY